MKGEMRGLLFKDSFCRILFPRIHFLGFVFPKNTCRIGASDGPPARGGGGPDRPTAPARRQRPETEPPRPKAGPPGAPKSPAADGRITYFRLLAHGFLANHPIEPMVSPSRGASGVGVRSAQGRGRAARRGCPCARARRPGSRAWGRNRESVDSPASLCGSLRFAAELRSRIASAARLPRVNGKIALSAGKLALSAHRRPCGGERPPPFQPPVLFKSFGFRQNDRDRRALRTLDGPTPSIADLIVSAARARARRKLAQRTNHESEAGHT